MTRRTATSLDGPSCSRGRSAGVVERISDPAGGYRCDKPRPAMMRVSWRGTPRAPATASLNTRRRHGWLRRVCVCRLTCRSERLHADLRRQSHRSAAVAVLIQRRRAATFSQGTEEISWSTALVHLDALLGDRVCVDDCWNLGDGWPGRGDSNSETTTRSCHADGRSLDRASFEGRPSGATDNDCQQELLFGRIQPEVAVQ